MRCFKLGFFMFIIQGERRNENKTKEPKSNRKNASVQRKVGTRHTVKHLIPSERKKMQSTVTVLPQYTYIAIEVKILDNHVYH